MARLLFLSPMVPSTDLDASVRFLGDALGFKLVFSSDTYRICERDGLTFHLQQAGENVGGSSIYLEVDNLDAVWAQLKPHTVGIRVREPFEQPYGMREFHVDLPHTPCLLFVGQSVGENVES